jgi:hypothetical protein
MIDDPAHDSGFNEAGVYQLSLPVPPNSSFFGTPMKPPGLQIVYGNVEAAVEKAEALQRPLLTYPVGAACSDDDAWPIRPDADAELLLLQHGQLAGVE